VTPIARLLREPLLHFLLFGAALFLIYDVVGGEDGQRDRNIVVTAAEQERLAMGWARQWQRPPTADEFRGLIEGHLREEVLFREAVAMGLDEGDTIIRRRLAQKMEFLSEDLATAVEPTEEELRSFLEAEPERFRVPARSTFSHVYVSRDRRGDAAARDAEQILEALRNGADPAMAGDTFMLQARYAARSEAEIAQLFGTAFAARVVQLEPGPWQGPVASGYGLHLVRVEERIAERMPDLSEVRAAVRNELLARRRRQANQALVAGLRERYEIVVEEWKSFPRAAPSEEMGSEGL
jgi:peptidyl-prolyl cis-trans isomerase C